MLRKYGFFPDNVLDARLYFVESAFHAYEGKWATNARTPFAIRSILLGSMVHNERLLESTDSVKQELAESYVMRAGMLRALGTYVNRAHNGKLAREKAGVRALAAAWLTDDLGIASPAIGIDDLPCELSDFAKTRIFSCGDILRFYES